MSASVQDNVGIAFALVTASGAATAVGAALVLFRGCVQLGSTRLLAACLGLSAGVMLYVSFVEIFVKSRDAFEASGLSPGAAAAATTGTVFGGMLLVALLHGLLELIDPSSHEMHEPPDMEKFQAAMAAEDAEAEAKQRTERGGEHCEHGRTCADECDEGVAVPLRLRSTAPPSDEEGGVAPASAASAAAAGAGDVELSEAQPVSDDATTRSDLPSSPIAPQGAASDGKACQSHGTEADGAGSGRPAGEKVGAASSTLHDRKLRRTGILSAISLAGHNFPEGAATFVGALADPAVGATLAIAIAIHNIPEGICVATTLYWSTGSRWKAFFWAVLSGLAEPVGAGIVWLALQGTLSPIAYAVIFGLVAGMMIYICVKELLPTARRYDPEDTVTSASVFAGMIVMAISLVLFVV